MKINISTNKEYKEFLINIKAKIYSAQIKAALSVNKELILLYWELGKMIVEKQENSNWGDKVIPKLSNDLRMEFPDFKGLARTNMFNIRKFYLFYRDSNPIVQQLVGQLPWGHNVVITEKVKDIRESQFYIQKTIENNWSRNVLIHQIESDLYKRAGKIQNNFSITLPEKQSDLAVQTMKDSYIFDFLTIESKVKERNLEQGLIDNITKFLLELGKGFAFVGKQYHFEVDGQDFYIDLLFYHTRLKCYIAIDLKAGKFIPEYAGKMNFYLSALDSDIKQENDNPSIGLILCKSKSQLIIEYSLRSSNTPIGIAEYKLRSELPKKMQRDLPSQEELQKMLG